MNEPHSLAVHKILLRKDPTPRFSVIMPLVAIATVVLTNAQVRASTFVGNGGTPGEVETLVTFKQITEVYKDLASLDDQTLFTCNEQFENHSFCALLNSMTPEQKKFASAFMHRHAAEIIESAQDTRHTHIRWTHDAIDVIEGGQRRAADAVANFKDRSITINQERFIEMRAFERLFLITHELHHFTLEQGQPLSDEGEIGPFKGSDGKRQLINSVAAAAVMRGADNHVFSRFKSDLDRAQGWKKMWVDASYISSNYTAHNDSVYAMGGYTGGSLSFRIYSSSGFGLIAEVASMNKEKTILSSIKASETVNTYGLGLSYRFFPFQDPLTSWGQSYFVVNALAEKVASTYKLNDTYIDQTWSADAIGWQVACIYYFPIWKIWLHLGPTLSSANYEYSDLGLKYDKIQTGLKLGVSYGF